MAVRVGINGFGRIGRQSLKALIERTPDVEVVAVNDLVETSLNALLFKHDSTYGAYPGTVDHTADALIIDGREIKVLKEKDPAALPWGDLGVDIVLDSTGIFTDAEKARAHITAGAKKVTISAPAKGEDITIVLGVNETKYDPASHHVISNASCTTNCLAPAAKVVHDLLGIERGLMNTIHSYTNDQRILDVAHKDPRRARAAGQNIIPTTTGAAKALALVIPDLKGKFDGFSLRVPTPTVSVVDFTADVARATSVEELNAAFRTAAEGPLKGILGVNEDKYDPSAHHVISNASCTTNCLAPAAKVVHDLLGIQRGLMNTIHSYTNDQRILDVAHKDPRRARAAGQNIIPTTTGAAKALALVIPDLKGKFHGFSLRVPTPTVSVVDFTADVSRPTSVEELNEAFRAAAEGPMKGILGYSEEPLVSMDFKGDPRSSIIDAESTMVLDGTMVKVIAWYDNEWGYSCRVADLIGFVAARLPVAAG
jgi:glyceraldehyde 3-phosphate dehydrogenase